MLGNRYIAAFVGILLLLVIGYNVSFFMARGTAPVETVRQPLTGNTRPAPVAELVNPAKSGQEEAANNSENIWKRDPFSLGRKAEDEKPPEQNIKLTGIIRGEKPYALINGEIYAVNDRIGIYVIKEIKQHSILIEADGIKQEITFDDYKVVKEKKK